MKKRILQVFRNSKGQYEPFNNVCHLVEKHEWVGANAEVCTNCNKFRIGYRTTAVLPPLFILALLSLLIAKVFMFCYTAFNPEIIRWEEVEIKKIKRKETYA